MDYARLVASGPIFYRDFLLEVAFVVQAFTSVDMFNDGSSLVFVLSFGLMIE